MVDHLAFIETLSRSAAPVRRPAPPAIRAAWWTVAALPAGLLATSPLAKPAVDWAQPGAIWGALAILLSFAIGVSRIADAFTLSIAGRAARPPLALGIAIATWLALNVAAIATAPSPLGRFGMGHYCFSFMLLAAAPMIVLTIAALRRTRALRPERALATAGVGIAFVSMALLGLCHSPAGKVFDFGAHLVAGAAILGLTVAGGRRWVAL